MIAAVVGGGVGGGVGGVHQLPTELWHSKAMDTVVIGYVSVCKRRYGASGCEYVRTLLIASVCAHPTTNGVGYLSPE